MEGGTTPKHAGRGEAGTVLLAVALFLTLLLTFCALGSEAGRWFLVRAELSKSVDAGALAGAKNISNPHVDPKLLAEEFSAENFQSGYIGTPGSGTTGSVRFNAELVADNKIKVNGNANAMPVFGGLIGIHDVPVGAAGAAEMQKVEIMLVLDRSGSMSGKPMADLKVAAKSFLDYFADTQAQDKMGLISFATAVSVDRQMGINFVAPMKTAINAMGANGYTNSEDAIDQADGPLGFTNQSAVPAGSKVQQFLIFFSDGRPNTIRSSFKNKNVTHDAVFHCLGNCDPGDPKTVDPNLWRADVNEVRYQYGGATVQAKPTGDGVFPASRHGLNKNTTRWLAFDRDPVPGYAPDAYSIPDAALHDHVCTLAAYYAVQHAQELKDKGVVVFALGLGDKINSDFLGAVASGPDQLYIAPTSDDLQSMFQKVALDIKLRLVQ
jgi:uncharacterized protein YegL